VKDLTQPGQPAPPIFIISGGAGALGKHIARIALSQFPSVNPQVIVIPQVRTGEQLAEAVAQVGARGGTIIHTMVDPALRQVTGTTQNAAGDPVPAEVDAYRDLGDGSYEYAASTLAGSDGQWSLDLLPGTYELRFFPDDSDTYENSTLAVTVADGSVSLTLPPRGAAIVAPGN